ncbi:MAG: hypothetical protein JNM66_17570 [Bryobacterales bacterium]|nr:hypothetical protein [Bryobacterales bacterium]
MEWSSIAILVPNASSKSISTVAATTPRRKWSRALEALDSAAPPHHNTAEQEQAVLNMIDWVSKHRIQLGDDLAIRYLVTEGRKY